MIRLNTTNPLGHARALLAELGERAPNCQEHSERVVRLAENIAVKLGLAKPELDTVRLAAELHDLGKVEIPDEVLMNPESLDRDAWETMMSHTVRGERLLLESGDPVLIAIAPYVRHHHECFCGKGYPDGLAGENIPLISRIIAVADAYEAMSAHRPYRDANGHRRIIEVMSGEVGIRWDPRVFKAFLAVIKDDYELAGLPALPVFNGPPLRPPPARRPH